MLKSLANQNNTTEAGSVYYPKSNVMPTVPQDLRLDVAPKTFELQMNFAHHMAKDKLSWDQEEPKMKQWAEDFNIEGGKLKAETAKVKELKN